MKNIIKMTLVILTSLSFAVANAGTLSITGNAKATYSIAGSDGGKASQLQRGKAIGIENDFNLGASGELDNGMTWTLQNQFDGVGATAVDDSRLEIGTDYGTFGIYVTEGGLDVDNGFDQSVYARPSDTAFDEGMKDTFSIADVNNLQYHTPADLLPLGATFKVAYAPDTDTTINSSNATGVENSRGFTANTSTAVSQTANMGSSMTEYQIKLAPSMVEGLALGASYEKFSDVPATAADPESGAYYGTYAVGSFTIGYNKSYTQYASAQTAADVIESMENTKYSIAMAVNDALSVSYTDEESEPSQKLDSSTATKTLESKGYQAAYTMGGMTLGLAVNEHQNVAYTDGKDIKDTVFSIVMAF
jgi:hypothetical protein